MFSASLFFGFSLSPSLEKALKATNPALVAMFIDNESDYLHECNLKGLRYLGKRVEVPADLSHIESLATHLESLMKRLVPAFSRDEYPLLLVAVPSNG
jgi:hypothetical protein